ncbi:hypothetical protein ACFVJ4_07830 [Streptomyces sp. NPDC127178]|uniref:hypothetical protein n=1 Tax=unclassified Streptomyces TaxID=2593676 RepID=UPI003627F3FF
MGQYLGPLEPIGDRWVIGDPTRKEGLSVVLTPEGLEHRRRGETAPLLVVEWTRFLELRVRAAYRRWQTTPFAGFAGGHVIVLKALFDELTEAKALHRLGDPEWLGTAVAKLSSYTSWYAPRGSRLVAETVRNLGT